MKFSQMTYARPDVEALKRNMDSAVERFAAAGTFDEADRIFLEVEEMTGKVETMFTLAHIRHDIDTNDKYYDDEMAFLDEAGPALEEYVQKWKLSLLQTPFRKEFSEKYNALMFLNTEIALKTFSPEIIPELQKENALTTEYSKLLASAQIPFEGETYTLSQLSPKKVDADDAVRHAAWQAEAKWFGENTARLDSLYDELTHLRDSMGRKLGYDGYLQLGYYRMTRNCYTKEDVEKFRAAVVKYVVPLADRIYRRQAERLGKSYPMGYPDNALEFRSGNPKPCGSPEDILAAGKKFYHELSGETAAFIDFMYENELLDVLSRKGKASGGYCTTLNEYNCPFIFANFNGTSGDVEVITHEAGHAFANFTGRHIIPSECQWPTMEACEVHSMSMEFFAEPWADSFFGDDAKKFLYTHLSGALTFIPYGTMVDHFQHIVYENSDLTPAQRNEEWKKLSAIYLPWMRLDESLPFYGEGRFWQRQRHIYESPFYYIDYCLAQTIALQFWAAIGKDRAAAWEKYMAYTRPAGTQTFTELLSGAGLESPFGDKCLRDVCSVASRWLDDFDMTGIE